MSSIDAKTNAHRAIATPPLDEPTPGPVTYGLMAGGSRYWIGRNEAEAFGKISAVEHPRGRKGEARANARIASGGWEMLDLLRRVVKARNEAVHDAWQAGEREADWPPKARDLDQLIDEAEQLVFRIEGR